MTVDTINTQVVRQCSTDLEAKKQVQAFMFEGLRGLTSAEVFRFRQRLPVAVRQGLKAFHITRRNIQQQLKEAVK